LQADVARFCDPTGVIADLFAGVGTLSLPLAVEGRRVMLVEADRSAHLASRHALARFGGSSQALHRDLFRAPLSRAELSRFTTVIVDPPRAGAKGQVEELALSAVARIVYVSCNPASWARDAATLVAGGYRLEAVRPIGQFRWSTHVELSSVFTR
jgi:23S rRNA (uracil1939-C5)-methyltransferase